MDWMDKIRLHLGRLIRVAARIRGGLGWRLLLKGLLRAFELSLSFFWALSLVACVKRVIEGRIVGRRSVRIIWCNICVHSKGFLAPSKDKTSLHVCFGGFEAFGLQIRWQSTLVECFSIDLCFQGLFGARMIVDQRFLQVIFFFSFLSHW
jgi:hypothetical protein